MAAGWGPLHAARIDFSDPLAPRSIDFDDAYHPRSGALAQARHVFLGGNGLPGRWAGRRRFVVLETGFGLGHNFLATWAAWQQDAQRCDQLWYLAVEKHPPHASDLARAHANSPLPALAAALVAAWPPRTPDMHPIALDDGRVRLLLAFGDIAAVLPELVASVDAFYIDGFAPDRNPAMWDPWRLRQLPRLAAPGATLATWCDASAVRQGLSAAGFSVQSAPVWSSQREMTVATFAPRFRSATPAGRQGMPEVRKVAVVGAGLAGAAVARALAGRGLAVDVLEQRPGIAQATSGNAGGLFHGVVHAQDGTHARWLRAAALHTGRVLQPLLASGAVHGAVAGLLRGERLLDATQMRQWLSQQHLPADYLRVVGTSLVDASPANPSLAAGRPGWLYPQGGWAAPADLCRAWLAGSGITVHTGQGVQRLQQQAGGWAMLSGAGKPLLHADAVVLCHAADAAALLPAGAIGPAWPLRAVRGQTTLLPADTPGMPALHLPLADTGYALRLADGRLLCGATAQPDDADPSLRDADHQHNLATLARLTGWRPAQATKLDGRVGWRLQADDRLPLLGPLPDGLALAGLARADQPRLLPRLPGLYTFTALGSRGITHAALGGELLAAWLTGDPWPVPASLVDALDVARFVSRAARRAASSVE